MKKPSTRDVFSRGYSRRMCKNLLVEFSNSKGEPITRRELLEALNQNKSKELLTNILGRKTDICCAKSFEIFFEAVIAVAKKRGYHNTGDKFVRLEKRIEKINEFVEYEYNYNHNHMLTGEYFDFHIRHELDRMHRIMLYHFFDVYCQIGLGAGSAFYSHNIKKIPDANLQGIIDKAYEIFNEDVKNISNSDMFKVISVTKLAFKSETEIQEIYDGYAVYNRDDEDALLEKIKQKIQNFEETHPGISFSSIYCKDILQANKNQLQLLILWLGLSRRGKDLLLDHIIDEYLE